MNTFNCVNSAEMHFGGWIKPKDDSEDTIQELESDSGSFASSIIPPAEPCSD